jgi:hypothetical protein
MRLPGRWMSHPSAVWQAEFKPFQLSVASEVGLSIPRTLVSNDPIAIRKAFDDFGSMIVKPARTGHVVHSGDEYSIFTSVSCVNISIIWKALATAQRSIKN